MLGDDVSQFGGEGVGVGDEKLAEIFRMSVDVVDEPLIAREVIGRGVGKAGAGGEAGVIFYQVVGTVEPIGMAVFVSGNDEVEFGDRVGGGASVLVFEVDQK